MAIKLIDKDADGEDATRKQLEASVEVAQKLLDACKELLEQYKQRPADTTKVMRLINQIMSLQ